MLLESRDEDTQNGHTEKWRQLISQWQVSQATTSRTIVQSTERHSEAARREVKLRRQIGYIILSHD